MSVFIRRFTQQVPNDVLLEIEAVNILDLDPPSAITGIGTGTVICEGEYEDGPFATGGNCNGLDDLGKGTFEVTGTTDFVNTFGELGYRYAGVPGNNPSARKRRSDGAIIDELWNGNAFVQLNGKRFRRLLCLRVDTSVGTVEFKREAFVTGAAAFAYNLEPGQILALDIGAGSVSATFTATAATVTSGAGVYPTTFVGGETLTLGYDGAANFVVTFLPADQTQAQVIARINLYAGFTFATDAGAGATTLTGLQRGSGGQVRVVAASAGVLAATGFVVGTTSGTGNVSNIDAVTFNEVRTVVQAAVGTSVEQDSAGRLRASKNFVTSTDYIQVGTATTATALGFTVDAQGSNDGIANYRSTAETFPTVAATNTLTLGVDAEANFNVTITLGFTQAQVVAAINAAAGFTMASVIDATHTLLRGRANGGEVRVVGSTVGILTDLGLTIKTIDETPIVSGTLPAGTLVRNTANTRQFVTMQTVTIDAPNVIGGVYTGNVGPYAVKVRHALDDGSGLSALAGSIIVVDSPPDLGSFDVVNPLSLTAALSETAIDAQYVLSLDTTLDLNTVSREANVIWASRQSNAVRRKLKENVITASSIGMFGRMCPIRPPIGSTKTTARSKVAEPGVGAYRDQRVIYTYPAIRTFVPIIARRGLAGGTGFSADGIVDVGSDGFLASILSQLAPEENPGQLTSFTSGAIGLESSANAQGFTIDDYIAFRANGICAPRMDDGTLIFQSGVTSVDPSIFPNFRNIARRRMADFIEDTLARRGKAFGKKLSTVARQKAISAEFRGFLSGLQSKDNPSLQRISGFSVDDVSGNTPETLGLGIYRVIVKVRTLPSLDAIVPEATVGELVEIDLPLAA